MAPTPGLFSELGAFALRAPLAGLAGACAFPLVVPGTCGAPLLDGGPRELGILLCAALLFRTAESEQPLQRAAQQAAIAGVVHFAVLLYWLEIALTRYGGMPMWQVVPVLGLLVLFCAAHWAALPAVHRLLRRGLPLPPSLAFATAVVVLEWLRSVLLTGFPWGLWGYSQARNLPVLQVAAWAGVYGVSFVVAYAGALLDGYVRARHKRRAHWAGLRFALLIVTVYGCGMLALAWRSGPGDHEPLVVAVAQGNTEQRIKNRPDRHWADILDRYVELAREAAARGAEVVVWPEAAWPGHLPAATRQLPVTPPVGAAMLVGATVYHPGAEPLAFNSAFWVRADSSVVARYDKQHLVPFGEYVPMRWLLPVEKVVPGTVDYSPGQSSAPLGPPLFGVLICYDGVFPEIARAEVLAGGQVLASLTNDAWYGVSSAPYQHRDFYVLRAVETDRWVARAANTGLSLFIDPQGRLHHQTGLNQVALVSMAVEPRTGRTFYVRFGNWLVAVCIGLTLAAALRGTGGRKRSDFSAQLSANYVSPGRA